MLYNVVVPTACIIVLWHQARYLLVEFHLIKVLFRLALEHDLFELGRSLLLLLVLHFKLVDLLVNSLDLALAHLSLLLSFLLPIKAL